jgi:hypothetical protein
MTERGMIKVLIIWLTLLTLAVIISVNELFNKCEALFFLGFQQKKQVEKLLGEMH